LKGKDMVMRMATPGGLEPPTFSLEGCCSIRLSYGAEGYSDIGL
jgi:hypothetical protein